MKRETVALWIFSMLQYCFLDMAVCLILIARLRSSRKLLVRTLIHRNLDLEFKIIERMNVQRRNATRELVKLHYSYYWYWAVDRGEITLKTKVIYFFHDSILFDYYKQSKIPLNFLISKKRLILTSKVYFFIFSSNDTTKYENK